MCENEEIKVLARKFSEFYAFTLQSIRHILNSTDVDKVTWCTKTSANASLENNSDSSITNYQKSMSGFLIL